MKSIRTPLAKSDTPMFRVFLNDIGLEEVKIGDYENIDENWYTSRRICYAYSEKSDEVVATLTHILLKYSSLYNAFCQYMRELYTSSIGDTFNWIP